MRLSSKMTASPIQNAASTVKSAQPTTLPHSPTPQHGSSVNSHHNLTSQPAPANPASNQLTIASPWSDAVQTLLDQPPASFVSSVLFTGLLFSGITFAWACVGTIEEVGQATGRLAPQGEVYKVQSTVQGEVARIWVEEGETVQVGEKIAEFNDRLLQNDLEQLQEQLMAHQRQLTQVHMLIDRTRLEAEVRREMSRADIRAHEADVKATKANIDTVHNLIRQLNQNVEAYEARLDRLVPLVEDGAIAEDNLFEIEQALRDRTQSLVRNKGELETQQAELERLESALQQTEANGQHSEIEVQQKLQQLEIDVEQIKAEIVNTESLIKSAKDKLEQMKLYAPVDGTVFSLGIDNIGEVIEAGQTVAEVAPETSVLVLSAMLPSQEAGLVAEGMPVNMKFDAFPYQDYGVLSGHVISIAPDSIIDQQLGPVYEVNIALERDYVVHEQESIPLKAGQTATAEIVVRKRRIIDVLLDPIRQLQEGGISL